MVDLAKEILSNWSVPVASNDKTRTFTCVQSVAKVFSKFHFAGQLAI